MRTTIDLPEDLHAVTTAIARDSGWSLSETVTALLRAAVDVHGPVTVSASPTTGLLVASVGRPVTTEDVRSLDDES